MWVLQDPYFLKNSQTDGTEWSKVPVTGKTKTSNKNIFKKPPTKVPGTKNVHEPYDAFKLFVSDRMIGDVVHYTNFMEFIQKKTDGYHVTMLRWRLSWVHYSFWEFESKTCCQ